MTTITKPQTTEPQTTEALTDEPPEVRPDALLRGLSRLLALALYHPDERQREAALGTIVFGLSFASDAVSNPDGSQDRVATAVAEYESLADASTSHDERERMRAVAKVVVIISFARWWGHERR